MAEHNFIQRKIDVLNKKDKSFAQGWDEKVISLCERIIKKKIITRLHRVQEGFF